MKKTLISLDPSSTCTGYAVFEYDDKDCELVRKRCKLIISGAWDLKKHNSTLYDRIECLGENISSLCFEWKPDCATYELPDNCNRGYANSNAYYQAVFKTQAKLWEILGSDNCFGVEVQAWKNQKKKRDTIREVNSDYRLKLTDKDDDEADAIGIADQWLQRLDTEREYLSDNQH